MMADFERQLMEARTDPRWGFNDNGIGTDEEKINRVMATMSPQQIAEMDRRFRDGVFYKGEVVRYDDGLEGYIKSEIENGFLGRGSAHREALLSDVRNARNK